MIGFAKFAELDMSVPASAAPVLRFDVFELDVRADQLRKRGVKLRLRGQPLQVLGTLLQRAGDLVTREELRAQIWPADTFVDFDHSLHNAIARLRQVLGDSATTPRYIETLPRRGYRFIAQVDEVGIPAGNQTAPSQPASDAPVPLCWVRERCVAKAPDGRYVSSRDLARELAAIRDRFAEPVSQREARPPNLPISPTGFVGREREVAAARELLLRPDVRLVTVTGPGGIGKSRLAVEVAGSLLERFPGGTHFVPLYPLRDPGLIASAIVQTLGITREAGGQSPLTILKENLQYS